MFGKSNDIGIDLGTANILIYKKGEGIILNEPSVVAVDRNTREVLKVGNEAYSMIGRTAQNIELVRPLKDGVIADFDITGQMLNIFLDNLKLKSLFSKPRILICCPTNITSVEKTAIKDVALRCGAKEVFVEEEPKVAAVGVDLNIFEPIGNLVVDIGGGTTDIAVLSMGDIVNSSSVKIAGDVFTQNIVDGVKNKYKLLIGQRTAEDIKVNLSTAYEPDANIEYDVKGRDIVSGLPKEIQLNEVDVNAFIGESINAIVTEIKKVLEETEPELNSDIIEQGIVLTGGGALIKKFNKLVENEIKVATYVADNPLDSVVIGTGKLLELNDNPNSTVSLV